MICFCFAGQATLVAWILHSVNLAHALHLRLEHHVAVRFAQAGETAFAFTQWCCCSSCASVVIASRHDVLCLLLGFAHALLFRCTDKVASPSEEFDEYTCMGVLCFDGPTLHVVQSLLTYPADASY